MISFLYFANKVIFPVSLINLLARVLQEANPKTGSDTQDVYWGKGLEGKNGSWVRSRTLHRASRRH